MEVDAFTSISKDWPNWEEAERKNKSICNSFGKSTLRCKETIILTHGKEFSI